MSGTQPPLASVRAQRSRGRAKSRRPRAPFTPPAEAGEARRQPRSEESIGEHGSGRSTSAFHPAAKAGHAGRPPRSQAKARGEVQRRELTRPQREHRLHRRLAERRGERDAGSSESTRLTPAEAGKAGRQPRWQAQARRSAEASEEPVSARAPSRRAGTPKCLEEQRGARVDGDSDRPTQTAVAASTEEYGATS
jgi:hypothetical protein